MDKLPLKIVDLKKNYGPVKAVKGVSFEVRPGEIFGLLGPNGAGKTSIISTIVTLEKPTSGQAFVFGKDVTQDSRRAKLHTGWVPQEIINHGFFNVEEILNFHAGYYGMKLESERRDYLLHQLALWDHRKKKVRQLSGGMKRRLMIAKALVHRPQLLLLDEPTAGVDIELRTSLWSFVRELRAEGVSILLTTHYLEEAEELCDRVAFIHEGLIRREGVTKEIIQNFTQKRITLKVKGDTSQFQHEWIESQGPGELVLTVPMQVELCEIFDRLSLHSQDLLNISISEGRLEDAFLRIIKEPTHGR